MRKIMFRTVPPVRAASEVEAHPPRVVDVHHTGPIRICSLTFPTGADMLQRREAIEDLAQRFPDCLVVALPKGWTLEVFEEAFTTEQCRELTPEEEREAEEERGRNMREANE